MQFAPRTFIAAAVACAGAFGVLLVCAYVVPTAVWVDAAGLHGFIALQSPSVDELTYSIAGLADPLEVAMLTGAFACLALARGRPRTALLIVAFVALTSISSQLLKIVLAHPRYGWGSDGIWTSAEAFPSGHSTAAMSVAIALVIAVPARLRPAATVAGAGLAIAVGFSLIVRGWHFPSDVAGGYLLATGWAFALLAGLVYAEERWPERHVRSRITPVAERAAEFGLAVWIGLGAAVALPGAFIAALQLPDAAQMMRDHTSLVVIAAGLSLAAVALLVAMARLQRDV